MTYEGMLGLGTGMVIGGSLGFTGRSFVVDGFMFGVGSGDGVFFGGAVGGS